MHFCRASLLEHPHDPVTGRSADNGIIDHNDPFSSYNILQNIQLHVDTGLPLTLLRFYKGSPYISIFNKCRSVWNPGLQGISHRRSIAGLRYTNHQICLYRMILCQTPAGNDPRFINAHLIDMAIRSCKVNIFKDTTCMLFLTHVLHRLYAILRRYRHDLPRFYIPDKLCTYGIQSTAL